MKHRTQLFLFGLLSLVLSMMPATTQAIIMQAYQDGSIDNATYAVQCDDGTILGFERYNSETVYFVGAITESTDIIVPDTIEFLNNHMIVKRCGPRYDGDFLDFDRAQNVSSITLPAAITSIADFPSWVSKLYLQATTPPTLYAPLYDAPILENVTIYVPQTAYLTYLFYCNSGVRNWSTSLNVISSDWEPKSLSIHVPSAGQLANLLLNEIEQWSDVNELTVTGSLNAADLEILSRLTDLLKLDLSQTDITIMTGCRGLSKLSTVILPSTVTKIDEYAFYQCSSLSSISLPNVEEVGDYAFFKTGLRSVELPQAETIGAYAFARAEDYDDSFSGGLMDIQIPRVTRIGTGAFLGCANLDNVSIPSAKTICDYAFCNCFNLSEIDLSNVDSLGRGAFYMNTGRYGYSTPSLSSVTLSEHLSTIPRACFSQCTGLQNIELPSSLRVIEQSAFYGCPLTSISFPEGLQIIGTYAFYNCRLEYILLPEGLHTIESEAFYNCPLTSISIPSTINSIGSGAFGHEYGKGSQVRRIFSYVVQPFATSAFSEMTSDTLHVPAFSLNAYRMHDDWYHFASIVPLDGDLEKLHFNSDFTIYDYKGLADKVDMTLAYGSEYVDSWTSNITSAHVTVNANSALTLGEYVQYQDLYNRKSNYDYDLGQNIYTYSYCTSLISQNEITADKMCTNVYMRDGCWNFISFPHDVNVSDIVVPEGVLWVIRKYSGADRAAMTGNTWQNMTDGMVLKAGEGYIFHCYDEEDDEVCVSFPSASNDAGTLFAYEDVVKTLSEYPSEFAHNRSWNLVGNPYPSYFNTQEIEFDAPITVWNGSGYTACSLLDDSYVLTPNEAFFVQRPINAATMTFHKEGRMHELESASESYAPSFTRTRNASAARFVYNFLLADGSYTDRARLVVNEEAKAEYEVNCDASKFMSSNADVPQLYINDGGVKYAIDERPLGNGVINLGAYFGKAGEHTISLASNPNEKVAVMLTDRLTGTVANLSTDSYTFTAETGTSDDRFIIALESTTDIENGMADEAPITEVYTLDGKQVADTDNLPAGVYLIKKGNEYVKHVVKE